MVYSTDGLVLREVALGEHDKLLTILTPADGRITVSAKGARSARSKIGSATKLFTYANFEVYKKGESRYIKDASITEPFFGLSEDIEKMALASYICEVASDITGEGVSSVDIMRMTLNSFYAISKGLYPLPIIKAVYEIRAAGFSGYVPDLDGCAICSEQITKSGMLDVMNGCIYCEKCADKHLKAAEKEMYEHPELAERIVYCRLTTNTVAALRYALFSPSTKMFSFDLTEKDELSFFTHACEKYLLHHLERDFNTLNFYKSLFN